MIHICFALFDKSGRYSKFVGTTMCSIFENCALLPPSITIHILHDNTLSTENRDKFSYLAGRYNQLVEFYNVEELCADEIAEIKLLFPNANKTRYSIGMFYRFLIPNVLPNDISKALYLDADIIVNLDISELWRIDLGDKVLATVPDIECNHVTHAQDSKSKFLINNGFVSYEDYFCSGVLLLNLNRFREENNNIKAGMKFLNEHPEMQYPDQDILNYLYSKDYVKIHEKFDAFVTHERYLKRPLRSAIYHYVVNCLNLNMNDAFSRLWMKYFIKTPFFSEETIGHLYDEIRKLHDDLKGMAINISASVTGKNRAFFIEPQKFEWLKKIFSAHDDEIFLPAENKEESITKLLDEMKSRKGKTVFFIMTVKHMGRGFPFDRLTKEGFVEDVDFVRGWLMFSGKHGVPHDSRPLVKII